MPHNFHEQNIIWTFLNFGYKVVCINIHRKYFTNEITGIGKLPICNIYEEGDPYVGKIGRIKWELNNLGIIKFYKNIRQKIVEFINKTKPDIIYCFYGSAVLNEIKMIIESRIGIPLIHELLCYPSSLLYKKLKKENRIYKKIINKINTRIHASQFMVKYIKEKLNPKIGKDIIYMHYFSEKYFFKKRLPLISSKNREPHIIFLGVTDFSNPIDDVREQIHLISRLGIHVHLREPAPGIEKNKYIHIFPVFDSKSVFQGELSTYMTQFDACIVTYNVLPNYRKERFYFSLPSRFLFALTAGIPIVMPKGIFLSCEDIIKKYKIGFTYEKEEELLEKLNDHKFMNKMRQNAIENAKIFTAEFNFYKLQKVLES